MTRTTNRPAALRTPRGTAAKTGENVDSFVSWAPSDDERSRDRAARRGDIDTGTVAILTEDDARAAFARSLRALGLNACANVMMVAKAA
jgi:hypothetical protein